MGFTNIHRNINQMFWLFWKFPKLFSFIITFTVCTRIPTMASFLVMKPHDQIVNSDIPDISHAVGLRLCETMNRTRTPDLNRYLWTKILVSKTEDSNAAHVSVKPGCFVFRWKKCS